MSPEPFDPQNPASRRLRLLLLEDQESDAELMIDALRNSGFELEWNRVDTEADFVAALDSAPDLVLADYAVPGFDGLAAFQRLQERKLDIPFIIVSGALGEELAVRCIKQGVTDYLLKDRLQRLGIAVLRSLEERRLRVERGRMEAQLNQAQKMEAIGQLAGGIAHDFNNILTVINGYVTLLLESNSLPSEATLSLNHVYTACEKAIRLTRQLLFFSRKHPIERRHVDLNEIIGEVTRMLHHLLGEQIEVQLALAHDLARIEADPSMMEQVLINLLVNARDAIVRGGRIVVKTEACERRESDARTGARRGRFVCMSVQDSGTGIAPDVMAHIFEPLFTTKEAGRGTGLGLATVASIVKQHEGWIEVESRPGTGATFRIFLPLPTDTHQAAPGKLEAPEARVDGGAETILVVEDESSVREFAVAVLKEYGYRVLQARSGNEALEVWKWHRQRIQLLLTDLVLPDDMTGAELAAKVCKEKPVLAVIITSGYSENAVGQPLILPAGVHFIQKPYPPRALAKLVRDALDEQKNHAQEGNLTEGAKSP